MLHLASGIIAEKEIMERDQCSSSSLSVVVSVILQKIMSLFCEISVHSFPRKLTLMPLCPTLSLSPGATAKDEYSHDTDGPDQEADEEDLHDQDKPRRQGTSGGGYRGRHAKYSL